MLNAVRFGAKRKIKRHKNTLQWYKYNPFEPLKNMAQKGKTPIKKWNFRG